MNGIITLPNFTMVRYDKATYDALLRHDGKTTRLQRKYLKRYRHGGTE